MKYDNLIKKLKSKNIKTFKNEPLKKYTTFQIGGPADVLSIVTRKKELVTAIKYALKLNVEFIILGGGSNVLISDKGIKKFVIINKATNIEILKKDEKLDNLKSTIRNRLIQTDTKKLYSFKDLDYKETGERILVKIDSGTNLMRATLDLIKQGITGLQWYAGIPGTIGGAVFNNIHGGTHFLSEVIKQVEVLNTKTQEIYTLTNKKCDFKYDYSRFHSNPEIILSATFSLYRGDGEKALYVFQEWTKRKIIQPKRSAGSIWQNLDNETIKKLNLPTGSWGYIIDKIFKLKGKRINNAQISTKHAGFIENIGDAKASDVLKLIKLVEQEAEQKLQIKPKREVFLLGEFD